MSKKQIDVYRTGKYLRLSQGDEDIDGWDKQESNSISNQKLLLEGFIDAHDDLKLVDVFIDDGYSGSNFDRPEFQRMMASMEAGNLDCIIVKDLSRLARERIGADELILRTFKKYGVRFIAVSDNYDSMTANRGETHTNLHSAADACGTNSYEKWCASSTTSFILVTRSYTTKHGEVSRRLSLRD